MAAPLTPSTHATLNKATPQISSRSRSDEHDHKHENENENENENKNRRRNERDYDYEYHVTKHTSTEIRHDSRAPSSTSPVVSHPILPAAATRPDRENMSPSPAKQRHSRVISGNELSPLKILSSESNSTNGLGSTDAASSPSTLRNHRKSMLSPIKRFPVKINPPSGGAETSPRPAERPRELSLAEAIRDNSGLHRAIQIFEDDESAAEDEGAIDVADNNSNNVNNNSNNVNNNSNNNNNEADEQHRHHGDDSTAGHDDTMASTFSTFSAVPNLTMFSKLGRDSPSKRSSAGDATPRGGSHRGSSPASPASRYPASQDGSSTNNLLEFTEQLRYPQKTPSRGSGGYYPPATAGPETPARQGMNLIDFDIPPMPTPRSVPSITPRELESLKSNLLSEISSLKASLSGKEAEVSSLKTALADAERRAGESTEALRELRTNAEHLSSERDGWERRATEMEGVLRKAKEEIMLSQREREELEVRVEEGDKRREAAEIMAQEAESKMAGMRAGKATAERGGAAAAEVGSAREVEMAVEKVARELHALYKSKHETKVTALRKSYESRWEKRVRELEARMAELTEDNERLRLGRDATMTRVDPSQAEAAAAADEERRERAAADSAHIRELAAEVERLEAVLSTVSGDNGELRALLEQERVEKGDLVQLAEEMMAMQASFAPEPEEALPPPAPRENHHYHHQQQQQPQQQQQYQQPPQQQHPLRTPAASRSQQAADNLRGSISRASGLRAPRPTSVTESRIGRGLGHERTRSNGLPRPGQKNGLQSAIERMGSHRRE